MKFGILEIDPAKNPAILDTGAWDPQRAWQAVSALSEDYWQGLGQALAEGRPLPEAEGFIPYGASRAHHDGRAYFLAGLDDGQQVFVEISSDVIARSLKDDKAIHTAPAGDCRASLAMTWPEGSESPLGEPVGVANLGSGGRVAMYPTGADVIDRFFRFINPDKGPKALGNMLPRLGIGVRMTTAVWPAIWRAMQTGGFAANAIQNSVRELNLLHNLLAGNPPEANYAFNFGVIESGYTGSTFEGLWVAGALDALKSEGTLRYGADADHIQVKRGADGLARAKKLLDASRYYTLFTLDVSDILDYRAMAESSVAGAEAYLGSKIRDTDTRKAVLDHHGRTRPIGDRTYRLDKATIGRLVGKYWDAMGAVEHLAGYITGFKDGVPFDLELSIDEHPPEIATFDSLTTDEEALFVILEMQRRQIPATHVAPNFGVEKGVDYQCPDGLEGLEKRARSQSRICEELGVMVDFHSGDDLSARTRHVIKRATGGRSQFKISPSLQLLFAEALGDYHPELFRRWWDDAVAYARREADRGSSFAAQRLREYETSSHPKPDAHHEVFHHYSFAYVGRRDKQGQFLYRQEFYDLSPAFYRAYQDRVVSFLCGLAEDLF